MKKVELLAPAGNLERLKVALKYGADAVYVGGTLLNLRANAINFTFDELKEGIDYAHNLGKKVYVTVNIVMHNSDLKQIDRYLQKLKSINVDAIIVSDPCVLKYAKKHNIEVHLSTQQSTLNYESVLFWKNEGVKRIVLARECYKEDIKLIKEKTGMDIEVFIHGAMCAGISGRCVMSNFLTNRDANRGGCSQICRWDFELLDSSKNKLTKEKPFTFCAKDLMMYEHIKEMIDIGIDSFKIEGRMRSLYYIAIVVSAYRKIIDNYYNLNSNFEYNKDKKALESVANRESSVQFFNGIYDETCSYYNGRQELSNQEFLGIILDYKDKMMKVEQRNYFQKGDNIIIFGPNYQLKYQIDKIYDEDNNIIEVVNHPRQIVYIPIDYKVSKYDMIRVDKDR